ncbi:OTU domain-containing protein 4 isoform X1 [Elgaria multicarinata webbii]|uniref:OTU domain-containing protein 4 isoform X1 n=2 Tax=Elgaria multicarinata webbii TaxID=159646 RepID=UPI002FCCC5C0
MRPANVGREATSLHPLEQYINMEAAAGKPGGEDDDEVVMMVEPPPPPPQQRQSPAGNGVGAPADSAMDSYLRSQGLYRKRVAKDGSCLFRAVAEQVFHSQSQHLDIRMACINYLRKNREQFEAFIEGPFEEYLKGLENPQEWVGQVEISALSLMYKKDFIIYQEPNSTPSHVTENGFPDKVLLCFSNGSHYDIVYPIKYTLNAALCQSILYEWLYEKVLDVNVSQIIEELTPPDVTKDGNGESEASDSEDEGTESETATLSYTNGLKPRVGEKLHKHGKSNPITLPKNVLRSLNPSVYQNIEYDVWQQSKRDQQKRDFSIAAGMQYSVGDKCQVRLDHNGRFYNAHIQEVQSANGPVVVFVEELGAKHSVLLKNLKPLPQGAPLESWSTVLGKKIKKPAPVHGQSIQTDADGRESKNPNKPVRTPLVLPPRLQGPRRQHHLPSPGMRSEQPSPEHKMPVRNPSQVARKADRERTEELDSTNRDCNYFGLSPEERREKQEIEEMHSLYELQLRDEEAFPALSNSSGSQVATQTTDNSGWRKPLVLNGRRARSLKEEKEDAEAMEEKAPSPGQTPLDQMLEPKISKNSGVNVAEAGASPPSSPGSTQSPSVEQSLQEPLQGANPTSSLAFPEMHLPPTVPSLPAVVPAWPSEPTTYGPTGIPPQIPVSSVMATQATGLDSTISQPQMSSSPVTGIPVSLQAVNQPLMPLSQTLNPYQDPLYPGFPLTEKGERVITPPYSLCSTGEDLPNDKNILRFFFNLGLKAYSCPMWAPHSYLYPLHQACLTACRMYPKVPVAVYSHNPWMQELPLTQNGNEAAQIDGHFPVQDEVGMNGQNPQTDTMPHSMPLFIPAAQLPESQGLVCVESGNPAQALHAEYDESLGGKSMYPQPTFGGQNPFLGPVPVAPLISHLWYGYPVQGYVENSAVRQVVVPREDNRADASLPECGSPSPVAGCAESQEAKSESSGQGLPLLPTTVTKSECNVLNKTSTRVPRDQQTGPATQTPTQVKSVLQNASTETRHIKRQLVSTPKPELKSTAFSPKDKTVKAGVAGNGSAALEESRVPRTREESSEDECEVSNMLRSGRSKQFYNQTYGGGRRPRSDWSHHPGRGGYQYPRNEEPWKGPPTRNRDEGYQYQRSYRGRPYRHERRRANMGDGHRGHPLP